MFDIDFTGIRTTDPLYCYSQTLDDFPSVANKEAVSEFFAERNIVKDTWKEWCYEVNGLDENSFWKIMNAAILNGEKLEAIANWCGCDELIDRIYEYYES